METVNDKQTSPVRPIKKRFQFKKGENGLFLKIHHTVTENGKTVRIRIKLATFTTNNTRLIAIDHRGNIFIFDLVSKRFWKTFDKIPKSTKLCSISVNNNDSSVICLISTKDGKVIILNTDSGFIEKSNKISSHPIDDISVSTLKSSKNFLIYSMHEAYLIDFYSLHPKFRLETSEKRYLLKFVSFIPESEKILACFTNDTIHMWSGNDFKTIKIFHPIRKRKSYLNKNDNGIPELSKVMNISNDENFDMILDDNLLTIEDTTKGLINSMVFSSDGRYCCLTFIDNYLMILSMGDFEITKLIKLNGFNFNRILFISPQSDDIPAEMLLLGLTTLSNLFLIDCNHLKLEAIMHDNNAYKFDISKDGQMFCTILKTGELNVYKTSAMVNSLKFLTKQCLNDAIKNDKPHVQHHKIHQASNDCKDLNSELRKQFTRNRLISILKEYNAYPDEYRHIIWSFLLDLPSNKEQFIELIKKGYHSNVKDYDQRFPLKDSLALRNLKKIASCILHWCPALEYCDYLPMFIFPFLKIFQNNLLLSFELILTILLNQCQLWFEYLPLEPINYLGIIKNLLNEFDEELMEFYKKQNIKTEIYAFSLMKSGFSEVLNKEQWLQLWDHIVSNDVDFLVFCILSYNITQKKQIMNLKTKQSIEDYFHGQNVINMKRFINRVYTLINKCPQLSQPKRHLKKFEKPPRGFYQKLENYPRRCIEMKDNEIHTLRKEKQRLDEELRELEYNEIELIKHLEDGLKAEEHEKRLKEMEKFYENTLQSEQEKVACQRRLVLLHRKQLREHRAKVLQLVQESAYRKEMISCQNEVNELHRTIQKTDSCNQLDMMFADDDIRDNEMKLLEQGYQFRRDHLSKECNIKGRFKNKIEQLEAEYNKLKHELKKLRENQLTLKSNQDIKIDEMEEIFQKIQTQFHLIMKTKCRTHKKDELEKSEIQTTKLMQQVQELLNHLKTSE